MRKEFEQNGQTFTFSHWRFEDNEKLGYQPGRVLDLLPQEAVFLDRDGNPIGLSPFNPLIYEGNRPDDQS